MSHYLILLAIVPLSCFELTKLFHCKHRSMICGIAIGLVIAPIGFALLEFTYLPIIGKLLGLIGLLANLSHGSIGYLCLIGCGVLEPDVQISALQFTMINLINGMFFAYTYGVLGYVIDRKRNQKGLVRKVLFV